MKTSSLSLQNDGLDSIMGRAANRFAAPDRRQRVRELRSVIEPVRLATATARLRTGPTGTGAPMILFPGLGASDRSLALLRSYLTHRGHYARGWGLGTNRGNPAVVLNHCLSLVGEVAAANDRPVNLVGWSLGGVLAREVARDRPDLVERVATFGTPIYGPRYTVARRVYSDDQLAAIESEIDARYQTPLIRPLLAIHSPNDGVVDWRSCIDERTPQARNVAVRSSHLAMGLDPDVWLHLAEWFGH